MEMTVGRCLNAGEEVATAHFPQIRQFKVRHVTSGEPLENLESADKESYYQVWQPANPETVARFTAAGYFCARELHQHLGEVPVGLINSSWGGSVAEAWVSDEGLGADPETSNIPEEWVEYLKLSERWQRQYDEFRESAKKAVADGRPEPIYYKQPSCLFNAMISPLVGYGIRGVLWYQGEANVFRAGQYAPLFKALIDDWRKQWGRELPFLWVQLPNFDTPVPNWPPLRESQAAALELPNTAMAVAIDVGERWDIHPKDKQTVGYRLGLAARGLVYFENVPFRAPMVGNTDFTNGSCVVNLTNTADSLVTSDGDSPRGFALAGNDRQFYPAEATLDNGKIVVQSDSVTNPVALRYGFENWPPQLNLYSSYMGQNWLPVTPFRTDDWDIPTYSE
jgi:sialate O-acetylesterase